MRKLCLAFLFASACTNLGPASVGVDPAEQSAGGKADASGSPLALAQIRCAGIPDAGPAQDWLNPVHAEATKALGLDQDAHRGIDLVATAATNPQTLRGEIRYGLTALENENISLFACRAGRWQALGSATTNDEGNFELALFDRDRMPIGIRTMYVSVDGDRTGASFVAVVTPAASPVAFSDVDGTLTSSENAAVAGLFGQDVQANDGAAAALSTLAEKGYPLVYVTTMPRTFLQNRRDWLDSKGFPRGALRLADTVLLPGQASIDYKTSAFQEVAGTGLQPTIGLGNRASDATAYHAVDISGDHVFLKLGQYDSEDLPVIDAGQAVGVTSYVDALPALQSLPDAR